MKLKKFLSVLAGVILLASCNLTGPNEGSDTKSKNGTVILDFTSASETAATAKMVSAADEILISDCTEWKISFGHGFIYELDAVPDEKVSYKLPEGEYTVEVSAVFNKDDETTYILFGTNNISVEAGKSTDCPILMSQLKNENENGSFKYSFYEPSIEDFYPYYLKASLVELPESDTSKTYDFEFYNEENPSNPDDSTDGSTTRTTTSDETTDSSETEEVSEPEHKITYAMDSTQTPFLTLSSSTIPSGFYRLKISYEQSSEDSNYIDKYLFMLPDDLIEIAGGTTAESTGNTLGYLLPSKVSQLPMLLKGEQNSENRLINFAVYEENPDFSKLNEILDENQIYIRLDLSNCTGIKSLEDVTFSEYIKSLVLPPELTAVSASTFENCKNLSCIVFTNTETEEIAIPSDSFASCSSDLECVIPFEAYDVYNSISTVLTDNQKLTVDYGENVVYVDQNFENEVYGVNYITLQNAVTYIMNNASALKTYNIVLVNDYNVDASDTTELVEINMESVNSSKLNIVITGDYNNRTGKTTINGNNAMNLHVFNLINSSIYHICNFTARNLLIENIGSLEGSTNNIIFHEENDISTNVTFADCQFSYNYVCGDSGFFNKCSATTMNFNNCDILYNNTLKIQNEYKGIIIAIEKKAENDEAEYSPLNFTGCNICNNTVTFSSSTTDGTVTYEVMDTTAGSLIYCAAGSVNFTSCKFISNTINGYTNGVCLSLYESAAANLFGCQINNNETTRGYGAIYMKCNNDDIQNLTLNGVSFEYNTSLKDNPYSAQSLDDINEKSPAAALHCESGTVTLESNGTISFDENNKIYATYNDGTSEITDSYRTDIYLGTDCYDKGFDVNGNYSNYVHKIIAQS